MLLAIFNVLISSSGLIAYIANYASKYILLLNFVKVYNQTILFADRIIRVKRSFKIKIIFFVFIFFLGTYLPSLAAKSKCIETTKLQELISDPKNFLNRDIQIEGEFFSFSTLPLDFEKAMRSSKDFIGLVLVRPDMKEIPLVELKIAAPLEMFKQENLTIEHGDFILLEAKVYALALGEPWLEVSKITIEKKAKEDLTR
jgi:hypothetical protein